MTGITAISQLPTPTPWPDVNPANVPFSIPEISLWDLADDGIQAWNTVPEWTQLIQAIVVILLIVAVILLVVGFLRSFTNEESGVD